MIKRCRYPGVILSFIFFKACESQAPITDPVMSELLMTVAIFLGGYKMTPDFKMSGELGGLDQIY